MPRWGWGVAPPYIPSESVAGPGQRANRGLAQHRPLGDVTASLGGVLKRWPVLLYVLAAALLAVALVREFERRRARARGGRRAPRPRPTASPTPTAEAALTPIPAAGPGLAVGITEFNPNLYAADTPAPEPWEQVRAAIGTLQPEFFRLVIPWNLLQPAAEQPADLDKPETGLHARGRAVPGLGGRAPAAAGPRDPAARRRLADARGADRYAGLGRLPALGV